MDRPVPPEKPGAELKGRKSLVLWTGWLLGPGAWALHQTGSYAMIPTVCRTGVSWPLHALTALSLAIALTGAAFSYVLLRRVERGQGSVTDPYVDRSRFLARVGAGLCIAAALGIPLEASATWFLDYCTGV